MLRMGLKEFGVEKFRGLEFHAKGFRVQGSPSQGSEDFMGWHQVRRLCRSHSRFLRRMLPWGLRFKAEGVGLS